MGHGWVSGSGIRVRDLWVHSVVGGIYSLSTQAAVGRAYDLQQDLVWLKKGRGWGFSSGWVSGVGVYSLTTRVG